MTTEWGKRDLLNIRDHRKVEVEDWSPQEWKSKRSDRRNPGEMNVEA